MRAITARIACRPNAKPALMGLSNWPLDLSW